MRKPLTPGQCMKLWNELEARIERRIEGAEAFIRTGGAPFAGVSDRIHGYQDVLYIMADLLDQQRQNPDINPK